MPVADQTKVKSPHPGFRVKTEGFGLLLNLSANAMLQQNPNVTGKGDKAVPLKLSHSFGNIPLHASTAPPIQAKSTINTPGDQYEQEADVMADKVMRMPNTALPLPKISSATSIQRKCATCGKEEEHKTESKEENEVIQRVLIQRKCSKCEEEEKILQRKENTNSVPAATAVNQTVGSAGQPLDAATRSFMEPRFGFDFSKVRIHDHSIAHKSAAAINALAYTHQHNIVFGDGQYQPKTQTGRKLIAHELTHVVQQNGKVSGTPGLVQRTPGPECTPAAISAFVDNMHATWCDKPRSCSMQGDSCASATAKVAAGYGCVDARTVLQQKCFAPGAVHYETHMQQISEASAALRNCLSVMSAKCTLELGTAAAAATVAVVLGAAAKKALKSGISKAFIYAEAAAAVLLLLSGNAEAKISLDGDSALESLYKAMEQEGIPVSEELKKMIESDPDLKAMIEESAKKGGKLSDVQKEIAKKYADFVSKHMDEFTKEELEMLMTTTDSVGDNAPDPSVDTLKKALKQKSDQKTTQDGPPGTGQGSGQKADASTKASGDKSVSTATKDSVADTAADTKDKVDSTYKSLSPENKKKIKGAAPPVYKLFQQFSSGDKDGITLNDDITRKFFEVVPSDLTQEQSDALISKLTSSKGKTADEVLENLKKGVEEIRKAPKDMDDSGSAAADTKDSEGSETPPVSRDVLIQDLKEKAQKFKFKSIAPNKVVYSNILKKAAAKKFTSYVYFKADQLEVAGIMSCEVPASVDVTKLKAGDAFTINVISKGPFVDKSGKEHDVIIGNTIKIRK